MTPERRPTRVVQEGRDSNCLSAAPVMQTSYLSKRDWSNGADGLTGMIMDSSTVRHSKSAQVISTNELC